MAVPPIQWRPPERFVSGDTLLFQQNLPDYLPVAGWAVRLTITQPGGVKVAESVSVPDATNTFHTFNVPNFCLALDAGAYVITEEVFNAGTGERHQIYFADNFILTPDMADGLATGPIKTQAQTILEGLYDTYQQLNKLKFAETEDLRSRFKIQDQTRLLEDIKYWKEVRAAEIREERVRNGHQPGNTVGVRFCIGA